MLGKTAKDTITGFSGVVTGICEYLTGCKQVLLQPPMKKGAFVESRWFDIDRITVAATKAISLSQTAPGFDKPAPRR